MDWRELEVQVERIFAAGGYVTQRNIRLTGTSGGTHEVDVLAERRDALTLFRVGIECKAWKTPINKDVVAKAADVGKDLGLHKVIIVSAAGSTTGAEKWARARGVELWGPEELERHAPAAPPAQQPLEALGQFNQRHIKGWPGPNDWAPAYGRLARSAKGFRKSHETLIWTRLAWLPAHRIEFTLRSRTWKAAITARPLYNLYDALRGNVLVTGCALAGDVTTSEVMLIPSVSSAEITDRILKAADKYWHLKTESARQRHLAVLQATGIPAGTSGITVERSEFVHVRYLLGLLESKRGLRIVAIDGHTLRPAQHASDLLTQALTTVRAQVESRMAAEQRSV